MANLANVEEVGSRKEELSPKLEGIICGYDLFDVNVDGCREFCGWRDGFERAISGSDISVEELKNLREYFQVERTGADGLFRLAEMQGAEYFYYERKAVSLARIRLIIDSISEELGRRNAEDPIVQEVLTGVEEHLRVARLRSVL